MLQFITIAKHFWVKQIKCAKTIRLAFVQRNPHTLNPMKIINFCQFVCQHHLYIPNERYWFCTHTFCREIHINFGCKRCLQTLLPERRYREGAGNYVIGCNICRSLNVIRIGCKHSTCSLLHHCVNTIQLMR